MAGERVHIFDTVLASIRNAVAADRKTSTLQLLRIKTDEGHGKFALACFQLLKNPEVGPHRHRSKLSKRVETN